jgi:DNA-binding transcriptional regulator YdaS (Cro superfamily)
MDEHPLIIAARSAGNAARLADIIGVSPQALSNWRVRGSVPIEHCVAIEKATGESVTRRDLRPDDWERIWPELVTAEHPAPVRPEKVQA